MTAPDVRALLDADAERAGKVKTLAGARSLAYFGRYHPMSQPLREALGLRQDGSEDPDAAVVRAAQADTPPTDEDLRALDAVKLRHYDEDERDMGWCVLVRDLPAALASRPSAAQADGRCPSCSGGGLASLCSGSFHRAAQADETTTRDDLWSCAHSCARSLAP